MEYGSQGNKREVGYNAVSRLWYTTSTNIVGYSMVQKITVHFIFKFVLNSFAAHKLF